MNLAKPFVGTDRSVIADPVDVDDCVHSTPFPLWGGELTWSQIGESRGEEEGPRLGSPGKETARWQIINDKELVCES